VKQIRSHTEILICTALVTWLGSASAAVLYVNVNSSNAMLPYTNWATAANVIQDAIDAASRGDEVVVTNGVYQTGGRVAQGALTNRVAATKSLAVRSVNGPNVTVIRGYQVPGTTNGDEAVRCAYLTNGASLIGFTLTGGATRVYDGGGFGDAIGGGVWCVGIFSIISNCVITSNSASLQGGGAYSGILTGCILSNNTARIGGGAAGPTLPPPTPWSPESPPPPYLAGMVLENCTVVNNSALLCGGGGYGAVLNNCIVKSNSAQSGGGADYSRLNRCTLTGNEASLGGGASGGVLNNCTLSGNSAGRQGGASFSAILNHCTLTGNAARQGGAVVGSTLSNCVLMGNTAWQGGAAYDSTLNHCALTSNSASQAGAAWDSILNNCILTGNSASMGGGVIGGLLNNCTLVANSATFEGGAIWSPPPYYQCFGCPPRTDCDMWGCGPRHAALNNCIVYGNFAPEGPNLFGFTNPAPMAGFYVFESRLNYTCTTPMPINGGIGNITNAPLFLDVATGDFRLQSNSSCINAGRNGYAPVGSDIDGNPRIVGGTVDIGAYEFQSPQSALSYAWLQQFGFPTDGSVDHLDADRDGHSNWQEWCAWTDPTDSGSALRLLTPVASANGLLVRWQSVSGQNYLLESSHDLGAQRFFGPVASNIVGQAGITTFADTNAASGAHLYYRVGVHE
jgi:hypothetical protein